MNKKEPTPPSPLIGITGVLALLLVLFGLGWIRSLVTPFLGELPASLVVFGLPLLGLGVALYRKG